MSPCPACATPTKDGARYCAECGADLGLPDSPTGTAPRPLRVVRSPASPATPASDPSPRRAVERFAPGHVLADRYRIVGLLGRGGMGEVYRADDLKLEQTVALKFLTPALAGDPERLERLFAEVRTARQVSHPAVCRVWDIGEAEGQHFLSMEFVDGENLASLLRRIGRFPQDKARDVARQVAEGLAAAHAKGLLHRDLKPANVMLDGQGHVRLTDFGLAGFADSLAGDVRSGTPSYMSPEQLLGREVTVRSDIYALGLLIYELVTGRRAFEGKGFAELARRHRDERPLEPSALAPGLDLAVERTILACLEKEPRRRPPSALAVAAMLTGRDPLEAAIAAGETPSPELVAAAGESEGLRPRTARACFAAVVAGILVFPIFAGPRQVLSQVPVDKSPAVLEDRARDLLGRLVQTKPVDNESGLSYDYDYYQWTREPPHDSGRWKAIGTGEPPLVEYWFRQSPRPITARNVTGRVTRRDPPIEVTGMAGATYDLRGRLLAFYAVPPQRALPGDGEASAASPPGEPDWAPLFAEAGLDPGLLRRVEPLWTPSFYVDARAAWEGRWPSRPEIPFRVEAAGYRGWPVWFEIKDPWSRAERDVVSPYTVAQRRTQAVYIVILTALLVVACALAYRNITLGRGDRRGAFRLALALAALATAAWALRAHHAPEPAIELTSIATGTGLSLLVAAIVWLLYLALEPYVRRLRPWTLVSWTRQLNGGVRDPVVGRDVLAGMTYGTGLALLNALARTLVAQAGFPERPPELFVLDVKLSTRMLLSYLLASPVDATVGGLALLLLFMVLRLVTRRDWIAASLVVAFMISGDLVEAGVSRNLTVILMFLPLSIAAWSGFVVLMLRLGVLAAITAMWTANVLIVPALVYAPGSWTGDSVVVVLPLLLAVAVLAFRSASGGRVGLRRYLAGEVSSSGA
jgi:serine/threonine-protein kinase